MNGLNNMSRGLGHMTHLAVPQSGDRREAGKPLLKLSSDRTWRQRGTLITSNQMNLITVTKTVITLQIQLKNCCNYLINNLINNFA